MTRIVKILETIWYRDKKPPYLLIGLSMVYALILKIRRALYDLGIFSTSKPEIPVIIIGNINVGGTGKTPFTLYLANTLSQLGKKVGIVSRGYKGIRSSSKPFILDKHSNAKDFGDEAVYLSKHTDAMVCVCKKRSVAANLLSDRGVDIILSDDGLQHYALGRDIEFAVVSSNRGFGNRYLLPAGPLREGIGRLGSLDFLLLNGKQFDQDLNIDNVISFEILNREVRNIHDGEVRPIEAFINSEISLIAGIGDPDALKEKLIHLDINVHSIDVADHGSVNLSSMEDIASRTIFLTPKDLVKYSKDKLPQETWELIPEMSIDQSEEEILIRQIIEMMK